ncbi:MAG: ABC transporter ATP-binding protein [Lachnospiraceae bacterium]|nr:ABC transporter ATP-binding protein [Lachnospiraceae bacterium]
MAEAKNNNRPPMGPGRPGGGPGHGPKGMRGPGGKPKNAKAAIKRIFSYIKHDVPMLLIVLVCVLTNTACSLAGSYLLRPIINNLGDDAAAYITAGSSAAQAEILANGISALLKGLLLMMTVYIFSVVCSYAQSRIMVSISQRAIRNMRNDLFTKMQELPIRFFDTNNHGDLMSRFTNDLDAVGEMLNNTIPSIISAVITLVGTLALMFYTNWILAIVTIVTMPLLSSAGMLIAKRSRNFYSEQQAAIGAVNGYVEEAVTGQKVIKVFCHEETTVNEFNKLNEDLRNKQIRASFVGGLMGPVMGNLSQISYAITALTGGILCAIGKFDIGGLTIFVNYAKQFSRPINEVSMQMHTVFSALAGAERVFGIMDQEPEMPDAADAAEPVAVTGNVVLKDVTFGYTPEKTILKNISLYAKPGQKIAFVGSTGAGKTTITNLLNRFYDIWSGEITIDGVDIRNYKRDFLRKNIAMVLQDTHLFTGTVRENIRYGRLDATDEEVEAAAKVASAHSFIMRLEHGYDTMLEGDGANLSQGQRQLLNIARAAISKAPILVLDEATSSVDTRTERHIEHGMDRLMKNRTTFVIAHRLSTVRNANAIMVLEQGEVIERGTHDELLELGGRYYELYTGLKELD